LEIYRREAARKAKELLDYLVAIGALRSFEAGMQQAVALSAVVVQLLGGRPWERLGDSSWLHEGAGLNPFDEVNHEEAVVLLRQLAGMVILRGPRSSAAEIRISPS